jgi:hypothetical protein
LVNDWLLQEFHQRVDGARGLLLTDRLSAALKLAGITVTPQEEKVEDQLIKERQDGQLAASIAWQLGEDPTVMAHWRAAADLHRRAAAAAAFYSGQTPLVLAQSEPAEPEKQKTDKEPK